MKLSVIIFSKTETFQWHRNMELHSLSDEECLGLNSMSASPISALF